MSSNWQAITVKPMSQILCYYTNITRTIQQIRVINSQKLNLEKIVFPQQRIFFEAMPEGQLEVYTAQAGKSKCLQVFACQNLEVNQDNDNFTHSIQEWTGGKGNYIYPSQVSPKSLIETIPAK
ncbi:MAG TPA: DUF1830 domain-containing protein [Xenococcaceae cyanobacterium]